MWSTTILYEALRLRGCDIRHDVHLLLRFQPDAVGFLVSIKLKTGNFPGAPVSSLCSLSVVRRQYFRECELSHIGTRDRCNREPGFFSNTY
jgi:hypothetical protein